MIKLESNGGKDSYYSKFSELSNYAHGRKMKIVFNKDPGFYWIGRVNVTSSEPKFYGSTITITVIVDPYKYEIHNGLQPYTFGELLNPDTIARNYLNLPVPGTLTIIGRRKRVCPKFICSNSMVVSYLENTYPLSTGSNQIPDIYLGEGDHVLTFVGSGTVSVDYRGASL